MRAEHDGHPLVATRALLEGRAQPFPSDVGTRQRSGRVTAGTLDRLQAIAETLFSVDGKPPPPDRIAWLRAEIDDFLARSALTGRMAFSVGSLVVSWVAPLLVGAFRPLARLPLERRIAALEAFERRKIALVLTGLRAIICLLYYEHPDAAAEVGIDAQGPAGAKLLAEDTT